MCGGGPGGDGPGGLGGETGATGHAGDVPGGNPGGGSGGNVGPGAPGAGGGATGRGDQGQQGAVGAPGTVSGPGGVSGMGQSSEAAFEGAQGQFGGLGANEAQSARGGSGEFGGAFDGETTSGMEGDPNVQSAVADALAGNQGPIASAADIDAAISGSNTEAFGFTPLQGFLAGSKLGGLPLGLVGLAMGLSDPNNPGNVSDYGGADPDAGGGPWAGDPGFMERGEERFPGGGDDSGLTFFGGGGSSYFGGGEDEEMDTLFSLATSPEPESWLYKSRLLQKDDDALGEDYLRGGFDKFTRSLF